MSQTNVGTDSPVAVQHTSGGDSRIGGQPLKMWKHPKPKGQKKRAQSQERRPKGYGTRRYGPKPESKLSEKRRSEPERRRDMKGRLTARRYAPDPRDGKRPDDLLENNAGRPLPNLGHVNVANMEGRELRDFAIRHFGLHYQPGETDTAIREQVQREMQVGNHARYA